MNSGRNLPDGRPCRKYQVLLIPLCCGAVVGLFLLILVIPASREVFRVLSSDHPMIMGFVKFALLATIGELAAGRITSGSWSLPDSLAARAAIWGIIGAVLALMLKLYSGGVDALLHSGVLPGEGSLFVKAAATSIFMNATFGPVMMAFHKMTDKCLELRRDIVSVRSSEPGGAAAAGSGSVKGGKLPSLNDIADAVDWKTFYSFIVLRTIPLFWFPAHTVTFMLPPEYQTIMAAFLSMALGVILSLRR